MAYRANRAVKAMVRHELISRASLTADRLTTVDGPATVDGQGRGRGTGTMDMLTLGMPACMFSFLFPRLLRVSEARREVKLLSYASLGSWRPVVRGLPRYPDPRGGHEREPTTKPHIPVAPHRPLPRCNPASIRARPQRVWCELHLGSMYIDYLALLSLCFSFSLPLGLFLPISPSPPPLRLLSASSPSSHLLSS